MSKRATSLQVLQRQEQVREDILNRKPRKYIVEKYSKEWNVTPRSVDMVIKSVMDIFKEIAQTDSQLFYEKNVEYLNNIIENNIGDDDPTTIKAIQALNKMVGLIDSKLDITSGGEKINLIISKDFIPKEKEDK